MSVCRTNLIQLSLAVTTCFGEHRCTTVGQLVWIFSHSSHKYVWNISNAPGGLCLSRNSMVNSQTLLTQQETGIPPMVVVVNVWLPCPDTGFTSILSLVTEMMLRLANGLKNRKGQQLAS